MSGSDEDRNMTSCQLRREMNLWVLRKFTGWQWLYNSGKNLKDWGGPLVCRRPQSHGLLGPCVVEQGIAAKSVCSFSRAATATPPQPRQTTHQPSLPPCQQIGAQTCLPLEGPKVHSDTPAGSQDSLIISNFLLKLMQIFEILSLHQIMFQYKLPSKDPL